jgi:hypothetical protein
MNAGWDMGKASMADAKRIAKLANTQDGPYLDRLWALVEYATDDQVRAFAYAQATHSSKN